MKKSIFLFTFLLLSTIVWSQKKEKIKASKIVTITQKEIGNFENIEIEDEIDVLRKWIKQGAKWGTHWAYATVEEQEIPKGLQLFLRTKLVPWNWFGLRAWIG